MLHAIDIFARGISGAINRGMNPPSLAGASCWQLASDRCQGFISVCEAWLGLTARFLFGRLLEGVETCTARSEDPVFLVHVWRICVSLSTMRFRSCTAANRLTFLRLFLHQAQDILRRSQPEERHPILVILGRLLRVADRSPHALKWTLGIGCWKSQDMLSRLFGQAGGARAASLNAGAYCVQNWRSCFRAEFESIESQYKSLRDSFGPHPLSEAETDILYSYLDAMSRIVPATMPHKKDVTPVVKDCASALLVHAAVLFNQTSKCCHQALEQGSLRYGINARAFAFTAELIATRILHQLDSKGVVLPTELDPSRPFHAYMNEAIEILRRGDLDCRVRAAELSKRLTVWLKTYYNGEKSQTQGKVGGRQRGRDRGPEFKKEKSRKTAILAGIFQTPAEIRLSGFKRLPKEVNQGWHNRWRREMRKIQVSTLISLCGETGTRSTNGNANPTPTSGQPRRRERAPKPEPQNRVDTPAPPHRRTCWNCSVTFPSRRLMTKHIKGGCTEQNPCIDPRELTVSR